MKIITLLDNLTYKKNLVAEHGFSLYIEESKKILFDTGQSSKFIDNALHLGLNLSEIDFVVISHGHFDHTGGLKDFFSVNKKAKILFKKEALFRKYKNKSYIGIPFNFEIFKERSIFVENSYSLDENITIVPSIKIYNNQDTHFTDFYIKDENDNFVKDDFSDELFLVIKKDNKINIISGCSHRGITNIIENAKELFKHPINSIIGGFHISSEKKENILKIADYFEKNSIDKIFTCHCTGIESYTILKNRMSEKIFYNFTGNEIII